MLDTREVSFIDCSGVHAILDAGAGADRDLPRLLLIPGPVVERFLTLAGIDEQIWTIELDPSEPERRLPLVPTLSAA